MIKVKYDYPLDAKIKLKARKMINGDILILDHPEIDMIISPEKSRVLALSKKEFSSHIYATQSRLFDYLCRKGVIQYGTVRSSNVFGSLQGTLLEDKAVTDNTTNNVQIAMYSIANFLNEEASEYNVVKQAENDLERMYTDPSNKDSTEMGEVPHEPLKGSNYFGSYNAYGVYGVYQENKSNN